jgi:outer membrane protein insertion porin family
VNPREATSGHALRLLLIVGTLIAFLVASLAAFLLGAGFAAARQTPAGQTQKGKLGGITVTGSKRFPPEQVIAASGLRPGQIAGREDFQAAADRLTAIGFFSNVQFHFSSLGSEVKLEFRLEDAPTVPILFDNFPWFTDDELTQALKASGMLFDGTSPTQGAILDDMAQVLEKTLVARGVQATVEHALVQTPDGAAQVQRFRVEGAGLDVSALDFTDSLATNDARVQERVSDILGKPFSRSAIELFNFEQVRPIYLEHAYLGVHFGRPEARFRGDPRKALPNMVVVIDSIEPGPVYTWGGVTWNGNRAVPSSEIDRLVGLHAGDPADGMKIQATWDRVSAAYGSRGYVEAKVEPREELDHTANRALYRVTIAEGIQYRMGDLVITNASVAAERKLREAWRIPRGEVLDRTYFEDFLANGVKLALGDLPVHYERLGRLLRTNPQTATVDVLIDFE